MRIISLGLAIAAFGALPAHAADARFNDREAFLAQVGASIIDTYETALGYSASPAILTDAAMSAVLGETRYQTIDFPDKNLLVGTADNGAIIGGGGNTVYCGGCNGAFTLHFDQTSLGTAGGIYGFGLDIVANDAPFSA